jgi:beta-N-acetylhexosaminidase
MPDPAAVASLVVTGLPAEGITAEFERFLADTPPAGVLLFRRNFGAADRLPSLVARLRALAAPRPLLVCVDEEGGLVSQLAPDLPVPPTARVLGRGARPEEVEALGAYTGRCLRALGVDVDFAPVLDVDAEPANPVIGPRAFADRPEEVARLGLAFARGLAAAGVLACAKHFPGHGDTRLDSHLALPRSTASPAVLRERDLVPFRAAFGAGVPLVMVSHVHYPALDAQEIPATLSRRASTALLRGELGFRGVAFTDAMEMKAVAARYAPGQAARAALEAGCDVLLYGAFTAELQEALARVATEAADPDGALATRIEEAAARVRSLWSLLYALQPGSPELPAVPPLDLVALCRRALRWVGAPPAVRPAAGGPSRPRWLAVEPRWPAGPALADLLRAEGWQVEGRTWEEAAAADLGGFDQVLLVLARRTPPSEVEAALLARACRARPTWVVALAQDAFLADCPGAAARLSACDPGEPMRRAVADCLEETAPAAGA